MPSLAIVVLFLEITLLILFGRGIGFGVAFLEVILTGVLGISLMVRVGRKSFQPAQLIGVFLHSGRTALSSRNPMEWFLFGCLLLIIPGLLTDLVGIVFIVRFILARGTLGSPRTKQDSIDVEFDVQDNDS